MRQLTRTLFTGVSLLAVSSLLYSLPKPVTVITPAQASNSPSKATTPKSKSEERMRISEAYGKLPLSFEENRGQADREIKFLSRGPNYTLLLTPTEAVLSLQSEKADSAEKTGSGKREVQSALLRMKLIGAHASPEMEGREPLQGKSNYLIGNDRKQWRTDILTYSRVQYDEVYPGIDLVYYGNQRRLEYDFVVSPGADPNVIRLSFHGADELSLDADGALRLKMKGGEVTQPAPVIYQKSENGERQAVAGHYVLTSNEVIFEIADYDRSRELVIDPQLLYATFYGGSGSDLAEDLALDGSGNAYIAGPTLSPNLLLRNAFDGSFNSGGSFIAKLNSTGTDIMYATYFGDSDGLGSTDGIAVTSDGKACVIGSINNPSFNTDFPITPSAYQGSPSFDSDIEAFVTVLTPGGNAIAYSTYFGGSFAHDFGIAIAVDASNKIYITGQAGSNNFPTKNAFQNSRGGGPNDSGSDAFIAKLDPAQSGNNSLIFSSFLGGSGNDDGLDIAVTPGGVAFIVGVTTFGDFPTKSPSSLMPFQTTLEGVKDAFIAKVSPTGALIYSTLFGGSGDDRAFGVAVDSSERAYVTGVTDSTNNTFPIKNAFDATRNGANDAFVAKLNADGTALFYATFLGGSDTDQGNAIAVDASGNAYVTGSTTSVNFPVVNGFPASVPSGSSFITKIEASDATGATTPKILYSDLFTISGGEGSDRAIAIDPRGNVYIAGNGSSAFATTPGAFQETNGGGFDAAIIKISSTFPDTIGVFRPPATLRSIPFLLRNSNTAGPPNVTVDFGQAGDQPLAGDWNGDGVDDVGVYRPSTAQFLLRQPTLFFGVIVNATLTLNFGLTGDKAVVGDWNGDGIDTPGVFRNGQWLLTNGPNTGGSTPPIDLVFNFGLAGETPVAGDWNGDGLDTIGVFRGGANGEWFLRNSNSTGAADIHIFQFGSDPGVRPVVGDWNGDGIDSIGLLANDSFFFRNTNTDGPASDLIFTSFAQAGDIPLAGDWNGRPDPFNLPNSGVNDPSDGSSGVGQTESFVTTCSDPDGWHDIATIDFKIARSDGNGNGVPIALWVQFNENTGLISFYDPDSGSWQQGYPGTNVVLSSRFAELHLADATVLGSGPTGPSVQITWPIVFKNAAIMNNYKQYLMITDDAGLTTGFDRVGSWTVKH